MSGSNLTECIICLSTFQSEPCRDAAYFTSVFGAFCCVMEVNLIGSMRWSFIQDNIPFCQFCYLAVDRLKGLYDQLNLIQKDLNDVLGSTKQKILTSGCANKISNELNEIDRVTYFRQQAVRGVQLAENPLKVKIATSKEHTDVLLKLEINEGAINENTSFLDCIKDEPAFQEQIDLDDSFDGSNNDGDIETACTSDKDLLCSDVKDDSDLPLIKSEGNEESVEASRSTSNVLISDPDDTTEYSYSEKLFQPKCSLTQHLKRHLEDKQHCSRDIHDSEAAYKCDGCHEGFHSANDVQCHAAAHNQKTPFKCDVCGECYTQSKYLNQHKKTHTIVRPFKCDTCNKCFAHKSNLTRHIRIHTGEKPFKCDACGKCFSQKQTLIDHTRTHTVEKLFKCDTCAKYFKRNGDLASHRKTHAGEKPFKCDVCDNRFIRKSNLVAHIRIHTGEKPYKCDTCDKCFTRKSILIYHKRIHTGEKPYKCDTCENLFRDKNALTSHKIIHTGEKRYKCDTCDKCFLRKRELIRHIIIHTGEKR